MLAGVVLVHELIQDGRELVQALQVSPGQLLQDAVAIAGQLDPDHAAVVAIRHPLHQPGRFGPVDELDRAVRPQQQVFSNAVAQGGQSNWAPYDGC